MVQTQTQTRHKHRRRYRDRDRNRHRHKHTSMHTSECVLSLSVSLLSTHLNTHTYIYSRYGTQTLSYLFLCFSLALYTTEYRCTHLSSICVHVNISVSLSLSLSTHLSTHTKTFGRYGYTYTDIHHCCLLLSRSLRTWTHTHIYIVNIGTCTRTHISLSLHTWTYTPRLMVDMGKHTWIRYSSRSICVCMHIGQNICTNVNIYTNTYIHM